MINKVYGQNVNGFNDTPSPLGEKVSTKITFIATSDIATVNSESQSIYNYEVTITSIVSESDPDKKSATIENLMKTIVKDKTLTDIQKRPLLIKAMELLGAISTKETGGENYYKNPFHFPPKNGAPKGYVLLWPGFTAYPQELRKLGERLSQEGYWVYCNSLKPEDYSDKANAKDWYKAIETAYEVTRIISENPQKVFVGGTSIGGTLVLQLAAKKRVGGIFTYGTPIGLCGLKDKRTLLSLIVTLFKILGIKIPKQKWEGSDYDPQKNIKEFSSSAVYQMLKSMARAKRALRKINERILVLQGREDNTSTGKSPKIIFNGVKSLYKGYIPIEDEPHTTGIYNGNEESIVRIVNFLNGISNQ